MHKMVKKRHLVQCLDIDQERTINHYHTVIFYTTKQSVPIARLSTAKGSIFPPELWITHWTSKWTGIQSTIKFCTKKTLVIFYTSSPCLVNKRENKKPFYPQAGLTNKCIDILVIELISLEDMLLKNTFQFIATLFQYLA